MAYIECTRCRRTRENKDFFRKKSNRFFFPHTYRYCVYCRKELLRLRCENDPVFKLLRTLRSRHSIAFRDKGWKKEKNKVLDFLGCDLKTAYKHIEKQFIEGMSWSNHGKKGWEIDHIIPVSSAKTPEDLIKLFHYDFKISVC